MVKNYNYNPDFFYGAYDSRHPKESKSAKKEYRIIHQKVSLKSNFSQLTFMTNAVTVRHLSPQLHKVQ